MLIDTHCHINIIVKKEFDIPLTKSEVFQAQNIIDQAKNNGVEKIINVATGLVESKNCIKLAKSYKSLSASVGIHPNDITDNWKNEIKELNDLLKNKEENKIVAIGECGLDYHRPPYDKEQQYAVFKTQIELALNYDIPLIIHTRNAYDETLKVLDYYKKESNLRGVFHCFSEDLNFAKESLELNFNLGIGGTLTYPKNNLLRQIVLQHPLDRIVLETDAPFLPPQGLRGTQNHPKNILLIAEFMAELKQLSIENIEKTTTLAAEKLFSI